MVSGVSLFVALFNNLAIFIALVAVYGVMSGRFERDNGFERQLSTGLAFGLFAVGCMHAQIPVYQGVIVDQRNAVVAMSGAFGGPWAGLVSALLAGSYRAYLGGSGVLSGVTGIGLAALSGSCLNLHSGPPSNVRACAWTALVCTAVILPGFLLVGSLRTGWNLMLAMMLPYGSAIMLGIFLVGLLLAREESRYRTEKRFRQMVA
ncbi:MAG TPA: LytS/YhcK type 5TM receptor domain-containing protein, partial [Polyangiaceae bacterium]|nr:LytS/YhcK type 5TM receptor domain-containing protein [Polyangiaceae bacterium]